MASEIQVVSADEGRTEQEVPESRARIIDYWVELFSSVVLALATVATAWCAYQSALWNGEQAVRQGQVAIATTRSAKFTNLAQQRISQHIGLFGQWAAAVRPATRRSPISRLLVFPSR